MKTIKKSREVIANHPFIFSIIDNQGTPIWVGRFTEDNKPEMKQSFPENREVGG